MSHFHSINIENMSCGAFHWDSPVKEFTMTYQFLLTRAMSQLWLYLICLRRSILSTTTLLTNRLAEWYGVSGMALAWFKSYLYGRHQEIKIDKSFSDSSLLEHGVQQGSVISPLHFSLYTAPPSTIILSYGLSHHLYADDTQIYISLTGDTATESLKMLQSCITGVSAWMAQSKLKLNPSKPEFLLIGSKSHREKFINLSPLAVLDNEMNPTDSARNLGVFFDSGLNFCQHISQVSSSCFLSH